MGNVVRKKIGTHWKTVFKFSPDELEQLERLNCSRALIDELGFACDDARWRTSNNANRLKRLEKMSAAVMDFHKTLDDIQEFAYDHFSIAGRVNEISQTASGLKPGLSSLKSLLDSKILFWKPVSGRPGNDQALELARLVKHAFEHCGLAIAANPAGLFTEVLCVCLQAIDLPCKDPSRIVRLLLDETIKK